MMAVNHMKETFIMVDKEFNLSEKMIKHNEGMFDREDVKQFIKLLKEELIRNLGKNKKELFNRIINKLAGDELSK